MVRPGNEDSFYARPPVFMVADGMGGAQAGEVASAEVAEAFRGFTAPGSEPEQRLAELIVQTNARIHDMSESDAGRAGMGTTVTAAVVTGGSVNIAHVGDSRAYRWRNGRLQQLTEDHSLVGEMLRQGRISEAEAETHPQRSIITRALGIEPGVEVDTASFDWQDDDIFLLCSDGLSSMVPDEEIAGILERSAGLEAAGKALIAAANTHGGRDNITVVLFKPGDVGSGEAETAAARGAVTAGGGAPTRTATLTARTRASKRSWRASCKKKAALIALAGALLLGASWFAVSFVYYVGTEDGYVAIYRGLPLEVGPLSFSSLHSVSNVRLDELEPFEQERVGRHELKSRSGAEQIVENYSTRSEEEQRLADEERRSRITTAATTATGSGG